MYSRLLQRLQNEILFADGAMGTMLQSFGCRTGECAEAWNLLHPDRILDIHTSYINSGSNIITTNTFGGTSLRLREHKLESQVAEINSAAAEIARGAARPYGAFVFGSIGPSGFSKGHDNDNKLAEAFAEQAQTLAKGGVDALILETMTNTTEMLIALREAITASERRIPVIASYSIQKHNNRYCTSVGESIEECVILAAQAGASIVGCNCGLGIDEAIEIVAEMRRVTDLPIIAQPNAGLPEFRNGEYIYHQTPEIMAQRVPQLIASGANIIGGCCGTNPEYIRLIAKAKAGS